MNGSHPPERIPPHAIEVEKSVIGMCLADSEARDKVFRMLDPGDLYSPDHQRFYGAMKSLNERGYPVDCITLVEELRRLGKLNIKGDPVYIAELTMNVASGANAHHHAHILLEMSLRRQMIASSLELASNGYDETEDIFDLYDRHTKFNNYLTSTLNKHRRKDKATLLAGFVEYLQKNQRDGVQRIPTPWLSLTKMLKGGLEYGGYSLIGGIPGTGKTSFMLSLAHHAATNGVRTSFIEGEMTGNEILERLNGIATGSDIQLIREGSLYKTLSQGFITNLHSLPFELVIASERTLTALVETIKYEIYSGSNLIIVDYLQVFSAKSTADKEFQEIKRTSETLRQLALQNNVHLCVASALNRREPDTGRLTLTHLYGSSGLGHDASVVMMLSAKQQDIQELVSPVRTTTLGVVKNRNGARGDITLTYHLDSQRMDEMNTEAVVQRSSRNNKQNGN